MSIAAKVCPTGSTGFAGAARNRGWSENDTAPYEVSQGGAGAAHRTDDLVTKRSRILDPRRAVAKYSHVGAADSARVDIDE
jgi:hypothetical protein